MEDSRTITIYHCMFLRCGSSYIKKCNLRRHVDVKHLKLLKFECDHCFKKFTTKQILIEHKDIHTGVKSFECGECSMRFRLSSQLSTHKRAHKRGLIANDEALHL